jgi:hypothetical protein
MGEVREGCCAVQRGVEVCRECGSMQKSGVKSVEV